MKNTWQAGPIETVIVKEGAEVVYDAKTQTLTVPPEFEQYAIEEQKSPGFLIGLMALQNFVKYGGTLERKGDK